MALKRPQGSVAMEFEMFSNLLFNNESFCVIPFRAPFLFSYSEKRDADYNKFSKLNP